MHWRMASLGDPTNLLPTLLQLKAQSMTKRFSKKEIVFGIISNFSAPFGHNYFEKIPLQKSQFFSKIYVTVKKSFLALLAIFRLLFDTIRLKNSHAVTLQKSQIFKNRWDIALLLWWYKVWMDTKVTAKLQSCMMWQKPPLVKSLSHEKLEWLYFLAFKKRPKGKFCPFHGHFFQIENIVNSRRCTCWVESVSFPHL